MIRGQHKGKTGYYDDDETEKSAVVYLGIPFVESSVRIPRSWLESYDGPLLSIEKFAQEHPEITAILGVRTRRKKRID